MVQNYRLKTPSDALYLGVSEICDIDYFSERLCMATSLYGGCMLKNFYELILTYLRQRSEVH